MPQKRHLLGLRSNTCLQPCLASGWHLQQSSSSCQQPACCHLQRSPRFPCSQHLVHLLLQVWCMLGSGTHCTVLLAMLQFAAAVPAGASQTAAHTVSGSTQLFHMVRLQQSCRQTQRSGAQALASLLLCEKQDSVAASQLLPRQATQTTHKRPSTSHSCHAAILSAPFSCACS